MQTTSFVVHATRGVLRDQPTRRRAMFIVLVASVVLLVLGSTVLASSLNPGEHPGRFIIFWIVCGWFTLTAILLAFFDLVFVRLESRRAQRALREKLRGSRE